MSKTRNIRLQQDKKKLEKLAESCHFLTVQPTKGNPPTEYMLTFKLRGYIDSAGNTRDIHKVRLDIPAQYPFSAPPAFYFTGKLWHPHVMDNGWACIGFHGNEWTPAFRIDDLVIDVAKFICFKEDSYVKPLAHHFAEFIKSHPIPSDNTNILGVNKIIVKPKPKPNIEVKVKGGSLLQSPSRAKNINIKIKSQAP
jgi:ubiquitin-protein ligase